ncbi:MAG: hypothetical protein CFE31_09910 [Rhizobiales bacterium PAR1]|nr:MAG: hypothetical protein CFE31_09910 [Rhizobiales bacterium PAR1]
MPQCSKIDYAESTKIRVAFFWCSVAVLLLMASLPEAHFSCVLPNNAADIEWLGMRILFKMLSFFIGAAMLAAGSGIATAQSIQQKPPISAQGLNGKHIAGYQGWFSCDSDTPDRRWPRWFNGRSPDNGRMTFDLWPDTSEFPEEDTCPTPFLLPSGQPARVFSSLNPRVVARHMRWMERFDIDIAALQRFVAGLIDPASRKRRDTVLANLRAATRGTGRGYFVMYDISGADPATWAETLLADWKKLTTENRILDDPNYVRQNGRPVLVIWGFGFKDRPATPGQSLDLIEALTRTGGATPPFIIGGVPTYWRQRINDQLPDPLWEDVYARLDGLSPWTVGRFADEAGAANLAKNVMAPDMAWTAARGKLYIPVIFPGFSFANGGNSPERYNKIPRRCGRFYWSQVRATVGLGAQTLYTAMFDEVDEGTAIMPVAPTAREAPPNAKTVTLDQDGCTLPPTYYLDLAGKATKALRAGYTKQFEFIPQDP